MSDGKSIVKKDNRAEDEAYVARYLGECARIPGMLDIKQIRRMSDTLEGIRERHGRLFIVGVGGGAGNATHAVNDFRKIAGIEAYTPTDNVSELTARINDDGWESAFANWLKGSNLNSKDGVLVFSVGGGDAEKKVSVNLVRALEYAKEVGASVMGIVGRDGGYTAKVADACVIIPVVSADTVTPHTEAFQAVIWHMIVSSPGMKRNRDEVGKHKVTGEKMSKAVFLDRDGVVTKLVMNRATGDYEAPKRVEGLELLPNVASCLRKIQESGRSLFLVSNQPDYAKGKTTLEMLDAIHEEMHRILVSEGIRFTEYYYSSAPPQGIVPGYSYACECRKPEPFFILKARDEYGIDLKSSWMVGDRDTDIGCGKAAGTKTILIEIAETAGKRGAVRPDYRVRDLREATNIILNNRENA